MNMTHAQQMKNMKELGLNTLQCWFCGEVTAAYSYMEVKIHKWNEEKKLYELHEQAQHFIHRDCRDENLVFHYNKKK